MKTKILFIILLSITSAQTLSVDEAVRIALENKSAITNAEKDVRIAQLNRNSSAALLLPSISASNSFRETTYGNSIITGSESYSGGVNLSQSLFNFGGKVNSVRQSDNSYQITKIQKRETTSRIILNVYTFYYQHLKDSELYEIAKEDLNLSKRQLDLVKQRFDLGAVSKTDYLKATVRYGSAKSTLLTRELSFNNSFKNLRNSMGLIGTDTKISLPKKVEEIIKPELNDMFDDDTIFQVNPTGNFVTGGPDGDTGVTGRKIIVDTYGGYAPHGGGAFSGKDCTKVDRSGAYMARYLAKNIVASGVSQNATIQLSYAIGVKEPVSLYVYCDGKVRNDISEWIYQNVDLTPLGIIRKFNLFKLNLTETTNYGHFGKNHLAWEKTDIANQLNF